MKSGSLVVKHHSPFRGRLVQAGVVITATLLGVGLYYFGQYRAGHNQLQSFEMQRKLEASIETLQADKAALRDRIALIEQSSQVDTQAYQQVKDNLRSLQQENLELREEVSFYRGIVAPKESSAGIRIDRFKIDKANDKGLYHYKFVLTQVLKNDRAVRGRVKMNIEGIENGRPKVLEFANVSADDAKNMEFNFRYFQKFEGDLQLPDNFKPRQVQMEVHPFKRKIIKSSFEWPGASSKKDAKKEVEAG